MLNPIMKFAKIVVASNGQQVLYFFEADQESDGETGIFHQIAQFDEVVADKEIMGISMEKMSELLDRVEQKEADALIDELQDLWSDD